MCTSVHARTNAVASLDKLKEATSTSHWIGILIEKKNRLNSDCTKEPESSEDSLLSWCTIGYSAWLTDWHSLWFSRKTTNRHQYGFSVLSHGSSVYCGQEQQHLSAPTGNKPLSSIFYWFPLSLQWSLPVLCLQSPNTCPYVCMCFKMQTLIYKWTPAKTKNAQMPT